MNCATFNCNRKAKKESNYCMFCLTKQSMSQQITLPEMNTFNISVPRIKIMNLKNDNIHLCSLNQTSNTFNGSRWKKYDYEFKTRVRPVSFYPKLNLKLMPYRKGEIMDKIDLNRKTAKVLNINKLSIYFNNTLSRHQGLFYYVKRYSEEFYMYSNIKSNIYEIMNYVKQSGYRGCYITYGGDMENGKVFTHKSIESLESTNYDPGVEKNYQKRDSLFLKYLKKYIHAIKRNSIILDVAGGTGRLAHKILAELSANNIFVTYIIIDANGLAVSQASEKLYNHQYKNGHRILLFHDYFHGIVQKEFADIIISSGGVINNEIVNYDEAKENIKLMSQCLKKGGLLLATGQTAVILSSEDYDKNGLFLEGTVGLHINNNGEIEDIDQFHQVIKL